ncbi:DUF2829 domain-containing protein [Raoultella planticola]
MTRLAYNDFRGWQLPAAENGADEGYLVEYLDGGKPNTDRFDGYVSWSPKDVFEKAYRKLSGLSFGLAIEALKQGHRVARAGWNGKNQWVVYVKPGFYDVGCSLGAKAGSLQPFLALKNAQDMFQPGWVPSMGDLLAEDWQVI